MRWQLLALPLVLLMDILVYLNFYNWQQKSFYEFEQRQLDLQVNYAVNAAMQETLETGTHIDTDYLYWGSIQLEPQIALDTYTMMLCRNFGWADTEANRKDIDTASIPFFILATYDGYYVYGMQSCIESIELKDNDADDTNNRKIDNYIYEKKWTPKIPYAEADVEIVENPDGTKTMNNKTIYMYFLDEEYYGKYEGKVITRKNPYINTTDDVYGSIGRAKKVISQCLTDACNSAMYMGLLESNDKVWYIPDTFSEWSSSRPISSPTILTYLNREDQRVKFDVCTFGVGGAKIDETNFFICYTTSEDTNGDGVTDRIQKLYTYSENRELVEADGRKCHIDIVVTSAEEAARMGYYYDIVYKD